MLVVAVIVEEMAFGIEVVDRAVILDGPLEPPEAEPEEAVEEADPEEQVELLED